MRLIPNWRKAWLFVSMWAYVATLCVLLATLYAVITTGETLGVTAWPIVCLIALQVIGMAGRIIQQPGVSDDVAAMLGE